MYVRKTDQAEYSAVQKKPTDFFVYKWHKWQQIGSTLLKSVILKTRSTVRDVL